jgi:hypothetical protein
VETALHREGFTAERQDRTSELAEIFPGLGEELAEWTITASGDQRTNLQLGYFDRSYEPVTMDVGPVLHLEDAAGGKICALANRAYERDYVDAAALLGRWTPAELIGFARRLDPGLERRDLADAALRLDRMRDDAFTALGLSRQDVATVRERFAEWPRDARLVSRLEVGCPDIGDSAATRHGREEPGHAHGKVSDRQIGSRGETARRPGRQRPAARERGRDDGPEISR